MRVEIRSDSVLIEGYVNAVGRDSRPLLGADGDRFVEQIVPGAFARALNKREVNILLNHDESKVLGSTQTNLTLTEDSIGLKARAIIKDSDIIEKAREKKLTGWSFGFYDINVRIENVNEGLKRRYVEDLDLVEVSIIDDTMIPAYQGTSIEMRADTKGFIKSNAMLIKTEYYEKGEPFDYSNYKERIKRLEIV